MASSMNGLPARNQRAIFSFITPSEKEKITYSANQRHLSNALQQHRWFQDGVLLDTFEKGVMYPVVHFTTVPANQPLQNTGTLLNANTLGPNFSLQQGLYLKIKQFRPYPENSLLNQPNKSRAYIVLGFKTIENTFNDMLEDMWKDWTGARAIYLNLPDVLGLSQLTFYRRLSPVQDLNVFMYILLVQCENVTRENRWMLLDYVQRLRVEKMMGYMSAYRVQERRPCPGANGTLELKGLTPLEGLNSQINL